MTTLDNPNNVPDPASVSPWPTALRYGLIGGLILIIYGFLGQATGFGRPSAGFVSLALFGLTFFIIYILLLYIAIRKHRDEDLGGYISLGRSVIVGAVVAIIAGLISAVYNYLYMTMIDPNMISDIIDETQTMMEEMGLDQDIVDQQIAAMEDRMEPTKQLIQGLLTSGIFGAIVSLIIGAIIKKEAPKDAV